MAKDKSFGAVLIAGLIGAVAGLLFAPKSGRETREDLRRHAQDMKGKAGDTTEKVKEAVKENTEEIKGTWKRSAKEMSELGEEAKIRAARIAEDARTTGSKVESNTRRKFKADD